MQAEDVERHFSLEDLRTLFKYNETTKCETHETFKCKRCRDGKQFIKAPAFLYGDTSTYVILNYTNTSWNHFENEALSKIEDLLLRQETGGDCVSAVFQYISH
jgi:DNA repair and recombination protein RAD54 and RAD54-like protein